MQRDFLIEVYEAQEPEENESLSHHGIIGQHWGVRRYQNKDGSLTPEGRRHWGIGDKIKSAKAAIEKKQKAKKMAALRKKKSEILARGDVDEILENKKLFTTNELDKAIGRSQRISMLKAMTPEQQKAREKAIKDQEKAARGKEAVDRGLYRAGQLVQMAPAMIQCYAIVRGLLGHGGSAPNASQVASTAATAAQALANPLAPASGTNQNGSNNGIIDQTHVQNGTSPYMNPHSTAPIYPNPSGGMHVSTGGTSGNVNSSATTNQNANKKWNLPKASNESALSTATYNDEQYKLTNKDAKKITTAGFGIDTSVLPSWSNSTTNATFANGLYEASTVPMSTLTSSDDWSDYVI